MTSISSIYGSGSAWQDMQDWSARQKAATDQFQNDTSQYTDSLFSGQVTQTQNLTTLIQQGAAARFQKLLASSAQTGGNQVNGSGDVFWGDGSSSDNAPQASAPVGGTSSDVYWGVDPTSPVAQAAAVPQGPTMGPSSDVYYGTPSVDITV
jgi:hypothetical protein